MLRTRWELSEGAGLTVWESREGMAVPCDLRPASGDSAPSAPIPCCSHILPPRRRAHLPAAGPTKPGLGVQEEEGLPGRGTQVSPWLEPSLGVTSSVASVALVLWGHPTHKPRQERGVRAPLPGVGTPGPHSSSCRGSWVMCMSEDGCLAFSSQMYLFPMTRSSAWGPHSRPHISSPGSCSELQPH